MKKVSLILSICLSLVLMAGGVFAATDTKTLTIIATVASRAKLALGQSTIHFPASDPDTDANPIPATENPVSVSAKVTIGGAAVATLTHQAASDLGDGTGSIPIGNVTWTVTAAGFQAGTMNKTLAQTAGSWTGPGNKPGTFRYFLLNSWDYTPGGYSATSTYTLTIP